VPIGRDNIAKTVILNMKNILSNKKWFII